MEERLPEEMEGKRMALLEDDEGEDQFEFEREKASEYLDELWEEKDKVSWPRLLVREIGLRQTQILEYT